jgi:hypothetical protein
MSDTVSHTVSSEIKEKEFNEKILKLLADPLKLRDSTYTPKQIDPFKQAIESKYNYRLEDNIYNTIKQDIKDLLIIDSILQNIINQVNLNQTP